MKDIFKEYLFTKHILVNDGQMEVDGETRQVGTSVSPEDAFSTIVALAKKFSIRIVRGAELAYPQMIRDAAKCLGEYVPEPFYRGFPESVKKLTSEERLFDQLLHYTMTYGMGWFDQAGHSQLEEVNERLLFTEKTKPKEFQILTEAEANVFIMEDIRIMLELNSRPLNPNQTILVWEGFNTFGKDILPDEIPCKQTVIELLYRTKNLLFAKYLVLSDVIKLLEQIQYSEYESENLKDLNLKNQDRKLITNVINAIFACHHQDPDDRNFTVDIRTCDEKKKIWCGLLHHIHYKPKTDLAKAFVQHIRNEKNFSVYAQFEKCMRDENTILAAKVLAKNKGSAALVRKLNYILSRCTSEHEVKEVLKYV